MESRDLEIRVGAISLAVGVVILLAGLWFARTDGPLPTTLFVDFPEASGLKAGSKVCVAGVPSGEVLRVTSFDGQYVEAVARRVFVRAELAMAPGTAGFLL